MVVCNHCGMEVETYQSKKEKICKQCYQRKVNCKNRNIEYIKVLDLPENEREKVMNRRKGGARKITKKKSEIIKSNNMKVQNVIEQKEVVMKDILNTFEANNAQWPSEYTSIIPIFKQLNLLLHNYIDIYFVAEDLLNKLEADYMHAKEYYSNLYSKNISIMSSEELKEINDKKQLWEDRHNALLEIRRNIKNVIMEYNNGGSLFTHLSKDEQFMRMFEDNYNRILKIEDVLKDGSYKARASALVENEEFCTGKKNYISPNKSRYQVTIKTMYRGVRNKTDFTRTVFAINEDEAIKQVIDYIETNRNKFKFTYTKNDITVIKL